MNGTSSFYHECSILHLQAAGVQELLVQALVPSLTPKPPGETFTVFNFTSIELK